MIWGFKKQPNKYGTFLILGMVCFFLAGHHGLCGAQEQYPSKPIKIIVPYEPAGINDLVVRATTDFLAQELKVPIVVENRPGASGMLGASAALKAKPDGYTLVGVGDASILTGPMESSNPPYDPFKDFLPICTYGGTSMAFAVHSGSAFKTLADLAKYAKENPGKLKLAGTVVGGLTHLFFELFKKESSLDIKHVPYTGTGEAIAALLGKHVDVMVHSYVGLLPYFKSGEARILAVSDFVPGTSFQTFSEAGYPKCKMAMLMAFVVSSKTPKPIYERLVLAFERVAKNPELAQKWMAIGVIPDYKTPAESTTLLKERWDVLSKLVNELGLKK